MAPYTIPGVYLDLVAPPPPSTFVTGVPVFLGFTTLPNGTLLTLASWKQTLAASPGELSGYLGFAVTGFFQNGGSQCYVVDLGEGLQAALAALDGMVGFDLVCAPDLASVTAGVPDLAEAQATVLQYCYNRGNCFAILDSFGVPEMSDAGEVSVADYTAQRGDLPSMDGAANGALYAPWILVAKACPVCGGTGTLAGATCPACRGTGSGYVPPCGHVAGIYAATDDSTGTYKAPANAPVQGALDLEVYIDGVTQGTLNPNGINCIRAFPGRGILVWGARTLSVDTSWVFVNVCRTIITVVRWLAQQMIQVTFEPNNLTLWIRIQREVTTFLQSLYQAGALAGASPSQAFFVKCDAETNTPAVQQAGEVVTLVGVAPANPSEFVIVQIVNSPNGVVVSGPPTSAQSVTMES